MIEKTTLQTIIIITFISLKYTLKQVNSSETGPADHLAVLNHIVHKTQDACATHERMSIISINIQKTEHENFNLNSTPITFTFHWQYVGDIFNFLKDFRSYTFMLRFVFVCSVRARVKKYTGC